MRIDELLKDRQALSFEVFPPKPEMDADLSGIGETISDLKTAAPDFISVTYGAGGNNRPRALDIASIILSNGMNPLSHLTAVGYTSDDASRVLDSLEDLGVKNILALRGDIPKGQGMDEGAWKNYSRASGLVRYVSELGQFCIGGAAYPEGHQQSVSRAADMEFMREKEEAGASFFITQLFFDNDAFLSFRDDASAAVKSPIIAGIMPVFKARQIKRIVEISGCRVPEKLSSLLDLYLDDDASMQEAGIDYAARQISALWREGVNGIHIYTMNKSKGVLEILRRCGLRGRGSL